MIGKQLPGWTTLFFCCAALLQAGEKRSKGGPPRPNIEVRGVYGGVPEPSDWSANSLRELGVNAIFLHSGSIDQEKVDQVLSQGVRLFAEFNTMHVASYLEDHPDAAPIGPNGEVSPPPDRWQGICPTHADYRNWRMQVFRQLLAEFPLDGIWLDYHHAHASWEQADPNMPDTCFCNRCLERFEGATRIPLPEGPTATRSAILLGERNEDWVRWRCEVFTDWVREFRSIMDEVRPGALLGTFHNPWSDEDYNGARLKKLAIDLRAQVPYIDVFSPMPYHARFGHASDPGWISRQARWLGSHLGLQGTQDEEKKIWPIVQLSDWGEQVAVAQVAEVLSQGTMPPSSGIIIFAWGSIRKQPDKVKEVWSFFRSIE